MNSVIRFHAGQRRGFVFLTVLLLMVVAVATIGWSIARARAQSAVVAMQLAEYHRHHELLGVRSIVRDWLSEADVQRGLAGFSRQEEAAYALELPTGELITLFVEDGQATALARLDIAMPIHQRAIQIDILSRLPRNNPRYTRSVGPVKISFWGASPEVLLAACRGNYNLLNSILNLREQATLTNAQFLTEIRNAGFDGGEGQELLSILEFNPVLWRVNVEVLTHNRLNRYTLLAEVRGNVAEILEWRALPEGKGFIESPLPAGGGLSTGTGGSARAETGRQSSDRN